VILDQILAIAVADSVEKGQYGFENCSYRYCTPHGGSLWRAKGSKWDGGGSHL
jgi:hypothetical protein